MDLRPSLDSFRGNLLPLPVFKFCTNYTIPARVHVCLCVWAYAHMYVCLYDKLCLLEYDAVVSLGYLFPTFQTMMELTSIQMCETKLEQKCAISYHFQ